MIFYRSFVPPGDYNYIFNTRLNSFLNNVLNSRLVHYRQHLLRLSLGCWQKPSTQTCSWNYSFLYFQAKHLYSIILTHYTTLLAFVKDRLERQIISCLGFKLFLHFTKNFLIPLPRRNHFNPLLQLKKSRIFL